MEEARDKSLVVEKIVNDISKILSNHLMMVVSEINKGSEIDQTTQNVLKNLPIIKNLKKELEEAHLEISKLKYQISVLKKCDAETEDDDEMHPVRIVQLMTTELENSNQTISYADISTLVSDEVNRMENEKRLNEKNRSHLNPYFCNITPYGIDSPRQWDGSMSHYGLNNTDTSFGMSYGRDHTTLNHSYDADDDDDDDEPSMFADTHDSAVTKTVTIDGTVFNQEGRLVDASANAIGSSDGVGAFVLGVLIKGDDGDDTSNPEAKVVKVADASGVELQSTSTSSDTSDDDMEVEEIVINDTTYYTNDPKNGQLFEFNNNGIIGEELGHLEDGHAFFS